MGSTVVQSFGFSHTIIVISKSRVVRTKRKPFGHLAQQKTPFVQQTRHTVGHTVRDHRSKSRLAHPPYNQMAPNETAKEATATGRMSKSKSGKDAVPTKRKLIKPFNFLPGAIEAHKGQFETPQTSSLTPGVQEHEGAYLENGRWYLQKEVGRIFSQFNLQDQSRQKEIGKPGAVEADKEHFKKPQTSAVTPGAQEDKIIRCRRSTAPSESSRDRNHAGY